MCIQPVCEQCFAFGLRAKVVQNICNAYMYVYSYVLSIYTLTPTLIFVHIASHHIHIVAPFVLIKYSNLLPYYYFGRINFQNYVYLMI